MGKRYSYLGKFNVIPLRGLWRNEFKHILKSNPEIVERFTTAMEDWIVDMREIEPEFAEDLILPISFASNINPLELSFYASEYGPRFDSDEPIDPEQIAYWRYSRNRFLFSNFWLDLCKIWMPDGNWLRLDTEFHSILLDLNSRAIFDPRFYAERSAEYILDMLIIGEPVKNADYQQTSNVIAWLNYHLKWRSRYNLPEVLENALQHDLPEYLQIMRTFANVDLPELKAEPLSETQLAVLTSIPVPVNGRMV